MTHRFLEPIKLGNVEVKNRVVFLAMARCMSDMLGHISDEDIAYCSSVAAGGAGIVIPGAMVIDPAWPSVLPNQPHIWDDKFIPGLRRLVKGVHDNGGKILFQLWHPGAVNYSGVQPKTVDELTVEEIHDIQQKYFSAAKRAMAAGADGVEFQTCHTYLANQFFSPLWNHRTDEYGYEGLENRTRFAVECISGIREIIGKNKILSVKIQGFDFPEGEGIPYYGADGIQPKDAAEVAPFIEKAGADFITVSSGGSLCVRNDIMSGDMHRAEGWKVAAARAVKAAVNIPVAATGNLVHPDYMDEIMENGDCDMIGMGRGLFAEREFVNKCAEGREDELRFCVSCMNCANYNLTTDMTNCTVNPFATREQSYRKPEVNGDNRVVAIIGAGPAGLEAAVTLKQRGFKPVVFDARNELGGNVNVAKKPPCKDKFQWMIGYYENMVKKLSIEIHLNTEATVESIMALDPYAVFVATGTEVTTPPIPGLESANVVQSRELLDKDMAFEGKKIAIVGGGITGLETALYLKAQGNEVSVVDMLTMITMADMASGDPRFMVEAVLDGERCVSEGVNLYYQHKVNRYADGKLYVESVAKEATGEETALDADVVVLSTGVKPKDELFTMLKATGHPRVSRLGDVLIPSKVFNAVVQGSKWAYGLN